MSLVIICRNEAEYIGTCLASIASAVQPTACEIVIVDGRSTDDTIALCRAFGAASPIPLTIVESEPGYSRQRNAGVLAARFEWVVFISADVRVTPQWYEEIVAATGDADLLIGGFELVPDRGHGAWMAALARSVYPSVHGGAVERCSTVNFAARRTLLLAHPFDEEVAACEDKELAARLLAAQPALRTRRLRERPQHLARESFPRWLRKLHREARALALLSRRRLPFPDCFGWRAHARRTLLLAMLAVAAMAAHQPLLAVLAAVSCAASACLHAVRRARGVAGRHALAMLTVTAGTFAGLVARRERA